MISLYRNFIKGNHPIKRFHLLIFLFSQIKQRRNGNRLHICTILARKSKKRSFSRNSIFSLLFFGYQSHFYMTLVSNSPHVASILRVNISKLICDFLANFIYAIALTLLRSSGSISLNSVAPYRLISCYAIALTSLRSSGSISLSSVAPYRLISCYAIALTSLRSSGSISLSSVAPYRLTSLRAIEKRAHSSLRLGLLDSSPDPLHAELLLR